MLWLSSAQVEYCTVTRQTAGRGENLAGIVYQNKLFVQDKSYSQGERKIALAYCRQKLEQNILCLVVEDPTSFTVWYQDQALQLTQQGAGVESLDKAELENLVSTMRGPNGVKVKDRWHNLKLCSKSFMGSEAVEWLIDTQKISRQDALKLGQRLIDAGLIQSVDQTFQDGQFFYQFYSDTTSEKHQSFQLTWDKSPSKHQNFRLTDSAD